MKANQLVYVFIKVSTNGGFKKIRTYGNLKKLCEEEKIVDRYQLISREMRDGGIYTDGILTINKSVLIKSKVRRLKKAA